MEDKDIQEYMNEVEKIETVDIHGKQHPTYAGVLNLAHEKGLDYIKTTLIQAPLPENHYMAIVSAEVALKNKGVFTGIGDATPKNVNSMIAPHIVRMAETRAKGRALRDALNIAEALKEELGGEEGETLYNANSEATDTISCSIHKNAIMFAKQGKYGKFYSHKLEDGTWCNGK